MNSYLYYYTNETLFLFDIVLQYPYMYIPSCIFIFKKNKERYTSILHYHVYLIFCFVLNHSYMDKTDDYYSLIRIFSLYRRRFFYSISCFVLSLILFSFLDVKEKSHSCQDCLNRSRRHM